MENLMHVEFVKLCTLVCTRFIGQNVQIGVRPVNVQVTN